MLCQHLVEGLFLWRTSTVRGGLCMSVGDRHAAPVCKMQTIGTDARVTPAHLKRSLWSTAHTCVPETTHTSRDHREPRPQPPGVKRRTYFLTHSPNIVSQLRKASAGFDGRLCAQVAISSKPDWSQSIAVPDGVSDHGEGEQQHLRNLPYNDRLRYFGTITT